MKNQIPSLFIAETHFLFTKIQLNIGNYYYFQLENNVSVTTLNFFGERRKWIHYFTNSDVFIFLVSLSCYNQQTHYQQNMLEQAINIFRYFVCYF